MDHSMLYSLTMACTMHALFMKEWFVVANVAVGCAVLARRHHFMDYAHASLAQCITACRPLVAGGGVTLVLAARVARTRTRTRALAHICAGLARRTGCGRQRRTVPASPYTPVFACLIRRFTPRIWQRWTATASSRASSATPPRPSSSTSTPPRFPPPLPPLRPRPAPARP
jgi:hypothetical protein